MAAKVLSIEVKRKKNTNEEEGKRNSKDLERKKR